ncbi:MAG: YHYH protein [Myxococcota bacterium]
MNVVHTQWSARYAGICLALMLGCSEDTDARLDAGPSDMATVPDIASDAPVPDASGGRVDVRDAVFMERSGDCADHATASIASVLDIQRDLPFEGTVDIAVDGDACLLTSTAIPNHDFNDESASFATPVGALETTIAIPRSPSLAAESTALTLTIYDGIMLNGVVLDQLAAGCFGVGDGRSGCNDLDAPFRFDPMHPSAEFGTDIHNAHTQPDGRYHYHGDPLAMYGDESDGPSGVIGFAADGFPIYGPYFDDGTVVREAQSGYTLRTGERDGGPGGTFDGTFVDDYEFTDAGDLDECNGMTVDGQYGYYLTRAYPWVVGCFRGTPDPSFRKGGR